MFAKEESVEWRCRNSGYIHRGIKALEKCPVCDYPKEYFEIDYVYSKLKKIKIIIKLAICQGYKRE